MPRKSPALLPDGLYDQVVTDSLQQLIEASIGEHGFTVADLAAEDAPARMAEVLASTLARILKRMEGSRGVSWLWSMTCCDTCVIEPRIRMFRGIRGQGMGPMRLSRVTRHALTQMAATGF